VCEIPTRPDIPPPLFLAISPDSTLLAAGNGPEAPSKDTLEVWAVTAREATGLSGLGYEHLLQRKWVSALAFSLDGKYLAAGVEASVREGRVRVWEVGSWRELPDVFHIRGIADSLAFAPEGHLLAVGATGVIALRTTAKAVTVFDLPAGRRLSTYAGCYSPGLHGPGLERVTLAFSPVGAALAVAGPGGICMFDVQTDRRYPKARIGRTRVLGMAFSSSGRDLAAALSDTTVQVWNVDTSQEVRQCTLGEQSSEYGPCSFSGGGRILACAEKSKLVVRVWDIETCGEKNKFSM
jgi:WD40 repeat protein